MFISHLRNHHIEIYIKATNDSLKVAHVQGAWIQAHAWYMRVLDFRF